MTRGGFWRYLAAPPRSSKSVLLLGFYPALDSSVDTGPRLLLGWPQFSRSLNIYAGLSRIERYIMTRVTITTETGEQKTISAKSAKVDVLRQLAAHPHLQDEIRAILTGRKTKEAHQLAAELGGMVKGASDGDAPRPPYRHLPKDAAGHYVQTPEHAAQYGVRVAAPEAAAVVVAAPVAEVAPIVIAASAPVIPEVDATAPVTLDPRDSILREQAVQIERATEMIRTLTAQLQGGAAPVASPVARVMAQAFPSDVPMVTPPAPTTGAAVSETAPPFNGTSGTQRDVNGAKWYDKNGRLQSVKQRAMASKRANENAAKRAKSDAVKACDPVHTGPVDNGIAYDMTAAPAAPVAPATLDQMVEWLVEDED